MKFSVQSKALFNLASNVGRVICSKNAVTSLNNFLCTIEGNTLTLTGSDLENSLSGKVEVFDSWGDGTFQIDARRLTSLLKELAEQPITISVNEENYEIEVATANGQYSMVGLSSRSLNSSISMGQSTTPDWSVFSFMLQRYNFLKCSPMRYRGDAYL